jgi:hypothetical protein
MSDISMHAAIERVVGGEAAGVYATACEQWIARMPQAADALSDHQRPPLVPASVVPYGHPWLGWITSAGKPGAAIHIPTGHSNRVAAWHSGALKDTGGLASTLRHEVAHHVDELFMRRPRDKRIAKNIHYSTHWLRTIAAWHALENAELFAQQVMSGVTLERMFGRGPLCIVLASYDFSDELHPALKPFTVELPPNDPLISTAELTICTHCGSEFMAKRTDARFCSTRCRTANHRASKAAAA